MDELNRKRSAGGVGFSRKSSGLSLKESSHEDRRSIQYCNRLGCSTRLNSVKGMEKLGGSPEKAKAPKLASSRPMSSKSMGTGSSSKRLSSSTDSKKSHQKRPAVASPSETVEAEGSVSSSTTRGIQSPSARSKRLSALLRPCKQNNRRIGSNNLDLPSSSSPSTRRPMTTRSTGQERSKNLSSSIISDALPSGCSSSSSSSSSSSDLGKNKRLGSVRKRPTDGDKSMSGSSYSILSLSNTRGSETPRQDPRRTLYQPVRRDGPVSVRTRRAPGGGETQARLHERQDANTLSVSEPVLCPQLPQSRLTIREPSPIFRSSSGGRPNSSGRGARSSRLVSSALEDGSTRGPMEDREIDSYRRVNMEGIAEVLLALERIEHDDELTYEQVLVLETNLLGGFSFRDQHRDMRLDIDNMTYEELLALEEEMGTVSTALSEEALPRCLKRSSYMPSSQSPGISARGDDDIKCSICQEEYNVGDVVGKLACDHRYHVDCIEQWLRQKNWCPICKTSVSSYPEDKEE